MVKYHGNFVGFFDCIKVAAKFEAAKIDRKN